jgi:DNA-binding transcriptional LysR family regulator
VKPLWGDRLVLTVPANHKWRKKKFITVEELSKEPFVLREKGSATRDILETYFKEAKSITLSQFNICAELGSSEAIKEAIIAGLGVSIISIHAVSRELAQGLLLEIRLEGCNIERDFYLIHQKHLDIRPAHKLFIDFLQSWEHHTGY